jgi:hypothetical protein
MRYALTAERSIFSKVRSYSWTFGDQASLLSRERASSLGFVALNRMWRIIG